MTQQMHHLKCSTFREWPWCCEFSVRTAGWNEQLLQGGAGLGVNVFCLNQAQPFYSRFVIMPAEVSRWFSVGQRPWGAAVQSDCSWRERARQIALMELTVGQFHQKTHPSENSPVRRRVSFLFSR
jgi:hypothetical protein